MTELWASPFLLDAGDDVKATVRAYNARGWSVYSVASTTYIQAQTVPT